MASTFTLKLKDESFGTEGRGTSYCSRLYSVTKTAGGSIDPSVDYGDLLASGQIPAPLSPFPVGGFATTSLRDTMRFRGVRELTKREKSKGDMLTMVLRWDTDYIERVKAGGTVVRVLPSGLARAGTLKYSKLWRLGWATGPSAASAFPDVEIAGTKVDYGGSPLDGGFPQADAILWWLVDTTQISLASVHAIVTDYEGKINGVLFCGYPAGLLLCTGFVVNQVREEYHMVQMRMIYDQYFHHEQKPRTDNDGKIKYDLTNGKAKEVVWARPFEGLTDFNAIAGGGGSCLSADQFAFAKVGEFV